MSLFSDLLVAWPALVLIAAGVLVIVAAWVAQPRPEVPVPVAVRPGLYVARNWQPPTPTVVVEGPVLWVPPVAELELAKVLRRWGDSPEDRAARMLRSIADEQRQAVA